VDIVQHLFLEQQGVVNINSCKPNEVAFGNLFTPILVKQLTQWSGSLNPTWTEVFDQIRKETANRSQEVIAKQDANLPGLEGRKNQEAQTPFDFQGPQEVELQTINSGVIRALVIVDDNYQDPVMNADVHMDGFSVLGMLHNLPEICPNPTILSRKEATRDRILEEINSQMKVGPGDTLFVYYIGMGRQDSRPEFRTPMYQMGHYLDLQLPGKSSTKPTPMWRSELLQAMKSRNPRLAVLITDSCGARQQ
jgi:hypothetical protein